MYGSDDGNAHINTGIDKSANFGVGFLPLLGEPAGLIVSSARSSLPRR